MNVTLFGYLLENLKGFNTININELTVHVEVIKHT